MTQELSIFRGSYRLKKCEFEPMFECPVCEYPLRDDKDMISVKKLNACTDCIDTYYYQNASEWDAGWRPSLKGK